MISKDHQILDDVHYLVRVCQPTFRTRMFGTEHCRVFIVGNRLRAIRIAPPALLSATREQTVLAIERS